MSGLIKKYLPYALIIFAVFLIVPIFFANKTMENFFGIALYFIFLVTTVACSAIYCSKHGLDFLFALITPAIYIPIMFIYYGGFNLPNIILLFVYLASGIFGLFLGDLLLGDKRKQQEEAEKAEAEKLMLKAKRRDEAVRERRAKKDSPSTSYNDDDDFDYNKYLSDIDRDYSDSIESEIDDILSEYGSR
jgi:hypothetical protein